MEGMRECSMEELGELLSKKSEMCNVRSAFYDYSDGSTAIRYISNDVVVGVSHVDMNAKRTYLIKKGIEEAY